MPDFQPPEAPLTCVVASIGFRLQRTVNWAGTLPGGLIEPEEIPADAAMREVWEETGLIVELTGILGVYGGKELRVDYVNGDKASYVGVIFRGKVVGGNLHADADEILDLRYVSREEVEKLPHARWLDMAMDAIYSRNAAPHFQNATWHPQP